MSKLGYIFAIAKSAAIIMDVKEQTAKTSVQNLELSGTREIPSQSQS